MMRWWHCGALGLAAVAGCEVADRGQSAVSGTTPRSGALAPSVVPYRVPADSEITAPEVLQAVRRGRAILRNTRDSLPQHVRNRLQCVSCHGMDGTRKDQLSLIGVYSRFPQYRSRSGKVDLIEDRINDCFERSMNGVALDRAGRDMRDLVAYMAFLSRGVPVGAQVDGQGAPSLEPVAGDTNRALPLFAGTCAPCHGVDGAGTIAGPALWGPHSYNIGAGMARVRTAAAFIRSAMPATAPGTLTPQQAFDLATYINTRPRPDFAKKALDWPNGDPPPDVAYPTRRKTTN
jgi:thiosulfate dehydrogenase